MVKNIIKNIFLIKQNINKYNLGGEGTVYKSKMIDNRDIAVKIMKPIILNKQSI